MPPEPDVYIPYIRSQSSHPLRTALSTPLSIITLRVDCSSDCRRRCRRYIPLPTHTHAHTHTPTHVGCMYALHCTTQLRVTFRPCDCVSVYCRVVLYFFSHFRFPLSLFSVVYIIVYIYHVQLIR